MERSSSSDDLAARLESKTVHYLARYSTTRHGLQAVLERFARRKLADRPAEDIARAITTMVAKAVANRWVDDATWAEQQIAGLRRRGASRRAILARLKIKGIDPALAEYQLARHDQSHDPASTGSTADTGSAEFGAALRHARRRRLGPHAGPRDRQREGWQQRHLASFARAGFSHQIARRIMALDTPEDADTMLAGLDEDSGMPS